MEGFSIEVNGQVFQVEQGLHENLYEVSSGGNKFLIGKRENGDWEIMLQDSEQADISADQIGAAIDAHVKN